jgi:hypothetical protein
MFSKGPMSKWNLKIREEYSSKYNWDKHNQSRKSFNFLSIKQDDAGSSASLPLCFSAPSAWC